MEDLSTANMSDEEKIGQVLGLEGTLLDQLREAKAFKTMQDWNVFRRPATLFRRDTLEIGLQIQDINQSGGGNGLRPMTIRSIITGEKATGKSLLLLQAMSMAYLNNWIVINIPEGS